MKSKRTMMNLSSLASLKCQLPHRCSSMKTIWGNRGWVGRSKILAQATYALIWRTLNSVSFKPLIRYHRQFSQARSFQGNQAPTGTVGRHMISVSKASIHCRTFSCTQAPRRQPQPTEAWQQTWCHKIPTPWGIKVISIFNTLACHLTICQ